MNKRLTLIPITGLVLFILGGCGPAPNGTDANNHQITNHAIANTSSDKTVSNGTANTAKVKAVSNSTGAASVNGNFSNQIALIKGKGYSVNGSSPNASVQTNSGDTLTAWIGVAIQGDGYNQFVFFFLNGKYLGTDTAKPSLEITSAKVNGNGIAVTYPVYKENDSFANPTGMPVTITYTWNGAKLVPNKPYPTQFQASNSTNPSGVDQSGSGSLSLDTLGMINANTGWATGRNRVWLTRDGGVEWNNVTPHGLSNLKNLQMKVYGLDAKQAWLTVNDPASVNHPIAVYHTTNGGESWIKQKFTDSGEPISLHFQGAHGWIALMQGAAAGSERETIYQTNNGGNSWNKIATTDENKSGTIPFGGDKTGVSFINDSHGWATGFTPTNGHVYLYQTTDDGKTWNLQHVTVPSQFNQAQFSTYPPIFFNQQDGILPVSDGSILLAYRTTNGGKTWIPGKAVQRTTKNQALQAWSFPTMNDGFATDGNKVFTTRDSGQTWASVTPNISLQNVATLEFTSTADGWALMTSGALYHTSNGGQTWIHEKTVQQAE